MTLHAPERRRDYRQKANAMATLRPPGCTDGSLEAFVFELSMHGAGLSVTQALQVGAIFEFEMCDGRQSGTRIEVRSCRPRSDNMFDVGGQFC